MSPARSARFGACLAVILLQFACSAADCLSGPLCAENPSTIGTGSVGGRVQIDGVAASGVVVALSSESTGTTTATTSATGEYTFASVPIGSHTVSIDEITSDATCPTASHIVTVAATGQKLTRDFDCAYLRTASISGTLSIAGVPVPGVTVALSGESSASVESDEEGAFSFAGLRFGDYSLTLSEIPVTIDFGVALQAVTLVTGQALSVEFEGMLRATGTISGTVLAESEGLAGADVLLTTGPSSPRAVATGADGTYLLSNVVAGDYTVTVSTPDATFETASHDVAISSQDETITADFSGTYVRTASITGVVGLGGAGVSGVTVQLSGVSSVTASSDAQGGFSFTGLRFGEYTVTLSDLPAGEVFPVTAREMTLATGQAASVGLLGIGADAHGLVGAGGGHSCALDAGAARCWGRGIVGQLGTGVFEVNFSTPVAAASGLALTGIELGDSHTCGVSTAGDAYCWGDGSAGQLGDGAVIDSGDPVRVSGGHSFVSVSAGAEHSCGVTSEGDAYCWGENRDGQVDGIPGSSASAPVPVAGSRTFVSVSAGDTFTCGLTTTAEVTCWGELSQMPLGGGGRSYLSVSAASGFACGVVVGGDVYCAGRNDSGQLGAGSRFDDGPVRVSGDLAFASVRAGGRRVDQLIADDDVLTSWRGHACGITTDGAAFCWGYNSVGQLGDGSTSDSSVPVQVSGGHTFASLSTGWEHNCGVTTQGDEYCWGLEGWGALGGGGGAQFNTPQTVPVLPNAADISAGATLSCGLTNDGAAYCWGSNEFGQVGDGSTTDRDVPVPVAGGITFTSVSAGDEHACGLTAAGTFCWGSNEFGQLGDGTSVTHSDTPVSVAGNPFRALSVGAWHACGVERVIPFYGDILCWGFRLDGQGNNVPGVLLGCDNPLTFCLFESVSAGGGSSCGVLAGGGAYCWQEADAFGRICCRSQALAPGFSVASISTGRGAALGSFNGADHSCVIRTGGGAYCWGSNAEGQLGTGNTAASLDPALVAGGLDFSSVSVGRSHTCGVTTGGAAYCWGGNQRGQLGDNAWSNSDVPVPVFGGLVFTKLDAGADHTCGVTSAGVALCWGINDSGQLGTGAKAFRSTPQAVAPGT